MNLTVAKYIFINNSIRMSHTPYHKFLLQHHEHSCDGGGLVDVYPEDKLIVFFGQSEDFGKADIKKVQKVFENDKEFYMQELYFCFDIEDIDTYQVKFM